jgi:hypothetical protein
VKIADSSAKFFTKASFRPIITDSFAKIRSASLKLKSAELLSGSWAITEVAINKGKRIKYFIGFLI